MSYEAARLARFLSFPKSLDPRPLQLLITRYVLDLNLPLELLTLSKWIIDNWPSVRPKQWTSQKPLRSVAFPTEEVSAAALLLVVLKLTFGLDGTYEHELSHEAARVNRDSQYRLFSWQCWEKQERFRESVLTDCCFFPTLGDTFRAASLPPKASERVTQGPDTALRLGLQSCLASLRSKDYRIPLPSPSSFPFSVEVELQEAPHYRQDFTRDHALYFLGVPIADRVFEKVEVDYWTLHTDGQYSVVVEPFLPNSFAWLLRLLSSIVGCKHEHLYQQVVRFEKAVFLNKSIQSRFNNGWHRDKLYDHLLRKMRASFQEQSNQAAREANS